MDNSLIQSIHATRIRMRFTRPARVGASHWPGLAGFVKGLIGGDLPPDVWLAAPDGGVPAFAPEDEYGFVVYALESGLPVVDRLLTALARLEEPSDDELRGDSRAFGPRWAFLGAEDVFDDGARIGRATDLRPLTMSTLHSEAALRAGVGAAWMRLLSPVQFLRARENRPKKGVERYCRDARDLDGELLLARLRQSLNAFVRRLGSEGVLQPPDARLEITGGDLFWHGASQVDSHGGEKPVFGLGGVIGLEVTGPDAQTVWQWLVLGQHLGIGQRRGFGLGRYRLEGPQGERIGELPERRASLLGPSFSLPNLDTAWDAIRGNKRRAAFERELDKVMFGLPPDADRRTELTRMAERIRHGEYTTPALQGIIIRKPDGGDRALAVPPLLDRVLQRAVAQALTRVIEPVMYARSFGYRLGRNRMQARDLIQRLVRDGYTWFFESDIDSFFDAVDPVLIYNRLMSLLPDDPAIDQVMEWVTAPVRHQGRLIQREGLPQGSPLSPLLANLVLDDFDHDLVAAGFGPVRFADDFVVPCKSRAEAERAAEVVTRSLAEKGLGLNEGQSRIARFSDGLKFLGYRFLNDMAIETRKSKQAVPAKDEDPHPGSWLAGIEDENRHRREPGSNQPTDEHQHETPGVQTGEARAGGTLVIISEPGCVLYTRQGQLWRQSPDENSDCIAPWPELGGLLLLGYQRITQAAQARAMDHRVPVYFTSGFGRLRGALISSRDQDEIADWPAQVLTTQSADAVRWVARELVQARIAHQAHVLRRRGVARPELKTFDQAMEQAVEADSIQSLRGIEGSATRAYFAAIARLVPEWCGFAGRNRRPPRDPFNALLSLGYTMLYAQTETLIRIAGLHPSHGFYHQRRGRHAALASDLMEPFRHLIESTAIAQLNRRQLGDDDFTLDAERGCRLTAKARRTYLTALGKRLSGRMTSSDGESMTGHEHIHRQALALRDWLINPDPPFRATRLK